MSAKPTTTSIELQDLQLDDARALLEHGAVQTLPDVEQSPTIYLQSVINGLCDLSQKDPLTGLANRRHFRSVLEREIDSVARSGEPALLLMLDIDHFKRVNDTFGHPTGDLVLRETASTLTRCFKRKDDFLARYGGEEFAVVLRDLNLATARTVAERAMGTIRLMEITREGLPEPIRITASMGIARLRPGETAGAWIERADRALYQAKNGGRDRIEVDPIDLEEK